MATDLQIAANRLNALKATGPKTHEGKAAVSQNALKTGLHAKSDVIATESREEYETLIAEYYARYQPAVPEERCLVDNLITAEWLGRRYMAATTAMWDYDFRVYKDIYKDQDVGSAFMRHSEALGRAQRCITAAQRNFAQTLKQLHALQTNRASDPPANEENEETEPLHPQLVSFFHSEKSDLPIRDLAPQEDPPDLETAPQTPPIAA